jgi:hypothetical protein
MPKKKKDKGKEQEKRRESRNGAALPTYDRIYE